MPAMVDDASPSAAHATGRSPATGNGQPLTQGIRRSQTIDVTPISRRRSSANNNPLSPAGSFDTRRRGSAFSDFSLLNKSVIDEEDEDGIWNPGQVKTNPPEKSSYANWPLVFALLPAVGGLLFEGGSAFMTDVILLGLAAIFLRWSVTQPWNWYHAAQEVRVASEVGIPTPMFESDSDFEVAMSADDDAPTEKARAKRDSGISLQERPRDAARERYQRERAAAVQELRTHERLALVWCFLFPLLAAYVLHTLRSQLSQGSEGLVCDYNLHIFVIAAEIRPISHLITLLQTRTLRQQRIVANNPYEQQEDKVGQLEALCAKVEELQGRLGSGETATVATAQSDQTSLKAMESMVLRNYRDKVQPEVESVTRAMRRYEKKLSNIVEEIDIRLDYLDQRNTDAITLAAVAARQDHSRRSLGSWLVERATAFITLPFRALVVVLMFPFRSISMMLQRRKSNLEKSRKRDRKTQDQRKSGPDRIPARVSKR